MITSGSYPRLHLPHHGVSPGRPAEAPLKASSCWPRPCARDRPAAELRRAVRLLRRLWSTLKR